jgi:hypothetical protein
LLIAIIQHYLGLLNERLVTIAEESECHGKERFNRFLKAQLNGFLEHQEFIIMQIKGRTVQRNEEVAKHLSRQHDRMVDLYGSLFINW